MARNNKSKKRASRVQREVESWRVEMKFMGRAIPSHGLMGRVKGRCHFNHHPLATYVTEREVLNTNCKLGKMGWMAAHVMSSSLVQVKTFGKYCPRPYTNTVGMYPC